MGRSLLLIKSAIYGLSRIMTHHAMVALLLFINQDTVPGVIVSVGGTPWEIPE